MEAAAAAYLDKFNTILRMFEVRYVQPNENCSFYFFTHYGRVLAVNPFIPPDDDVMSYIYNHHANKCFSNAAFKCITTGVACSDLSSLYPLRQNDVQFVLKNLIICGPQDSLKYVCFPPNQTDDIYVCSVHKTSCRSDTLLFQFNTRCEGGNLVPSQCVSVPNAVVSNVCFLIHKNVGGEYFDFTIETQTPILTGYTIIAVIDVKYKCKQCEYSQLLVTPTLIEFDILRLLKTMTCSNVWIDNDSKIRPREFKDFIAKLVYWDVPFIEATTTPARQVAFAVENPEILFQINLVLHRISEYNNSIVKGIVVNYRI